MASQDKPDPLLNRLIRAHAEINRSGVGDFVTSDRAQKSARPDGKILGKNPNTSYFASGFDMAKIRKAFEQYAGDDSSPHPFIWLLEFKLKALQEKIKLSSAQLIVLRDLQHIIEACASVHPDVAAELEKIDKEREQVVQGRYGPKAAAAGPTPFEVFSGANKTKEA